MRAADPCHGENRNEDRHRPSGRDDDPAGALAFAFVEKDGGHNAIAEEDEKGRSDEFSEGSTHDSKIILLAPVPGKDFGKGTPSFGKGEEKLTRQ